MLDDLKLLIQNADPEDGDPVEVTPDDLQMLTFAELKPEVQLCVETPEGADSPIPGALVSVYRVADSDSICVEVRRLEPRKYWFDDIGLDVYARAYAKALQSVGLQLADHDSEDTWVALCYIIETKGTTPFKAYENALRLSKAVEEQVVKLLQPIRDAIADVGLG